MPKRVASSSPSPGSPSYRGDNKTFLSVLNMWPFSMGDGDAEQMQPHFVDNVRVVLKHNQTEDQLAADRAQLAKLTAWAKRVEDAIAKNEWCYWEPHLPMIRFRIQATEERINNTTVVTAEALKKLERSYLEYKSFD